MSEGSKSAIHVTGYMRPGHTTETQRREVEDWSKNKTSVPVLSGCCSGCSDSSWTKSSLQPHHIYQRRTVTHTIAHSSQYLCLQVSVNKRINHPSTDCIEAEVSQQAPIPSISL